MDSETFCIKRKRNCNEKKYWKMQNELPSKLLLPPRPSLAKSSCSGIAGGSRIGTADAPADAGAGPRWVEDCISWCDDCRACRASVILRSSVSTPATRKGLFTEQTAKQCKKANWTELSDEGSRRLKYVCSHKSRSLQFCKMTRVLLQFFYQMAEMQDGKIYKQMTFTEKYSQGNRFRCHTPIWLNFFGGVFITI